jgi:AraC-like DNA-binding protein
MNPGEPSLDPQRLAVFNVVSASDPAELDSRSRVSERLPEPSRVYKYRLRDPALSGTRFDSPIFTLATRSAGGLLASYGDSRFATEVSIDGDEGDFFCFTTMLQGGLTLHQRGEVTTATASRGLAFRPGHRTRLVTTDRSLRTNVFVKVGELEGTLEHMLDRRLPQPLEFGPALDWKGGLAASLRSQLAFVMQEFERPDGVAGNAVALASMTEFLATLILRGVPHNYADRFPTGPAGAVPAYVRRAEDFMRAHCAGPIRMADVAAAARCSVRTLGEVFRRFRDTTPLAALHAIRLEEVRTELGSGGTQDDGAAIAAVARRYGFTNASRFGAAFRRRFGEAPADVVRAAGRSLNPR